MKPYFIIPYNLQHGCALKLPLSNCMYYGIKSVLYRACLLQNWLSLFVKQNQSLLEVKFKTKKYMETVLLHWIAGQQQISKSRAVLPESSCRI